MRLRNNPQANDNLKKYPDLVYVIPENMRGKWHQSFGNDHPISIEIGMGKGDFIIHHALNEPDMNFIGLEKYSTVMEKALRKVLNHEHLNNLCLVKDDAIRLGDIFSDHEIDRIYLNFSDPWPKSRHAKRRLTYQKYLDLYKKILKPGGSLIFKTDNRKLFEYSLVSIASDKEFIWDDVCLDLHHSDGYDDNIVTEYERKFSPFSPIYQLKVHVRG